MRHPLPPELQPIVDAGVAMARAALQAGRELTGIAFIDAPHAAGTSGLVAIPMNQAPSKDAWANMVRLVSLYTDARFVMVASEIWMTDANTEAEVDALMAKHKEVRLIPGRREALLVQIETHDALWQGIADLKKRGRGKTFGALEFSMPSRNEGRLVGLLGSHRRDKAS